METLLAGLRSEADSERLAAADALVALAGAAVPYLCGALWGAPGDVQLRVVEILVRIGQSLPPRARTLLRADLDFARLRAASREVCAALEFAACLLRPSPQRVVALPW